MDYSIKVIVKDEITEKEISDVVILLDQCNTNDNSDLQYHLDFAKDDIQKIMFYDDDKPVAYFGVTNGFKESESISWAAFHPEYRDEVIVSEFLMLIRELNIENEKNTIRFVNDNTASYFSEALISEGATLKHSSFELWYDENNVSCTVDESTYSLRPASMDDLEEVTLIGMDGFGTEYEEEESYNRSNLSNPNINMYVCEYDGDLVGSVSTRIEENKCTIADLSVKENYRGKGIGRFILWSTIDELLKEGIKEFSLSVVADNVNALKLYTQCGFIIKKAKDFLELKL